MFIRPATSDDRKELWRRDLNKSCILLQTINSSEKDALLTKIKNINRMINTYNGNIIEYNDINKYIAELNQNINTLATISAWENRISDMPEKIKLANPEMQEMLENNLLKIRDSIKSYKGDLLRKTAIDQSIHSQELSIRIASWNSAEAKDKKFDYSEMNNNSQKNSYDSGFSLFCCWSDTGCLGDEPTLIDDSYFTVKPIK